MSAQAAPAKVTENLASQGSTIWKLALFAACLGLGPLSTYYLTLKYVWDGDTQYSALSAVFVANIVLVGYVFMAIFEDSTGPKPPGRVTRLEAETRKEK